MSVFAFFSKRIPRAVENKPREKSVSQDPPGIDWSMILNMAMLKRIMATSAQVKIPNP